MYEYYVCYVSRLILIEGRGRPSLKQLHDHHVLREAAIKWRYIGFNLLNDVTALDIIEANYKQVSSYSYYLLFRGGGATKFFLGVGEIYYQVIFV